MSDMRFIMLGSILAFSGFVLGGFTGMQYQKYSIQADQFGVCYDYAPNGQEIKVICNDQLQNGFIFLIISLSLIGGGVVVLVKGIRGKWDQDVKNDEMVGPKER